MARPKKVGLEYFPLDCQMDDKILMLEAEHGMEGFGVYIRLLQYCYQQEDGKLDMSIVFRWKTLGKTLGILSENLRKMVDTMLEIGLFDKKAFDEQQLLTSSGIQKRLNKVSDLREKERLRKDKADSKPNNELSGGKPELSGRKSTQKEKKRDTTVSPKGKNKKDSNSSAPDGALDSDQAFTLTHQMRKVVENHSEGYYWQAKDAKNAQELADKIRASFLATNKRDATDEDVLGSLRSILKNSAKLSPYLQFQDIPKLNERYNATITEIKSKQLSRSQPVNHSVKPD